MTQTTDKPDTRLISPIRTIGSEGNLTKVSWSDSLGMIASIGCAIHCAAMPFVIAYLPSLGLNFLADESFHQWMAVGCFAIAVAAFLPGIRRHGRWGPIAIGSVGLAMISIAAFGFAGECCVACSVDSTLVAAASAESCPDAGCDTCAASAVAQPLVGGTELVKQPTSAPTWFAPLVPWLTPLGGLVLVFAHLLNHRSGCPNACCQ
jgi:hypothetical protein